MIIITVVHLTGGSVFGLYSHACFPGLHDLPHTQNQQQKILSKCTQQAHPHPPKRTTSIIIIIKVEKCDVMWLMVLMVGHKIDQSLLLLDITPNHNNTIHWGGRRREQRDLKHVWGGGVAIPCVERQQSDGYVALTTWMVVCPEKKKKKRRR